MTGDPLVLQARTPGQGEWRTVSGPTLVGPDGWSRTTVTVTEDTEYRWLRPEGEYADAGASASVVVHAVPGPTAPRSRPPRSRPPAAVAPQPSQPATPAG